MTTTCPADDMALTIGIDPGHPSGSFEVLHVEDVEWANMPEAQRLAHQFGLDLLRDAYRDAVRALAERYDPQTLREAAKVAEQLAERRRLAERGAEEAAWRAAMCERHDLDPATLTRSGGQHLARERGTGLPFVVSTHLREVWPADRPDHVGPGPDLEGLPEGCRKWRPVAECYSVTRRWRLAGRAP